MEVKVDKKHSSIRFNIIASFTIIIVAAFFITASFIFSNWIASARKIASQIDEDTTKTIISKMEEFINIPLDINKTNHNLLESNIIDISSKENRDQYFAGILKSSKDEVCSFSYGTENGEYYAAQRNKNNEIEIIKSNESTNNCSYYYSTNTDLTSDELIEQTSKHDPRTRDWYITAKEKQGPVFSPIDRHFSINDLTITAAYPIYNKSGKLEGVLGTHITLSKINKYLKEIIKDKNGSAYIVERDSGELVANSLEKPNFEILNGGITKRITINELGSTPVHEAYSNFKATSISNSIVKTKNGILHITVTKFNKEALDWLIITSIPESQFTADIYSSFQISIISSIITVILAILIYMKSTKVILKPIYTLIGAAERFSNGDFSYRAKICSQDEIGKLSSSFNKMAEQLHSLINNLEEKVKERTIELEKTNEEITYLSYQDQLTGLYNRRYFEETLFRIDSEKNYPLTIVIADVNGLKLLNDSFGHSVGDMLIKKVGEVIKAGCRKDDIIARIGGDEFIIFFPKTESYEVEEILKRINCIASRERVGSIDISISFGYEVKRKSEDNIDNIIKKAEDNMYKSKLLESPSMRLKTVQGIVTALNKKNKTEEAHSKRVSQIAMSIGKALGLPEADIDELKTVALLHDIGKIAIEDSILKKPSKLTEEEKEQMKRHPEIGYRILSTVNDLAETAKYVLAHHERWDGKGYPKGLKGSEIPLQSRIIAIAGAYEAMTSEKKYRSALSKELSAERLKNGAGAQFDPELVEIFINEVLNKYDF